MSRRRFRLLLTFTACALVLGYWGFYEPEYEPPRELGPDAEKRIDGFIIGAVSTEYDQQGNPRHKLLSKRMDHYPSSDSTLLQEPDILIYRDQQPPIRILAEEGEVGPDNQEVFLRRQVSMVEQSDSGFSMETEYLRIEPDNDYAETDTAVTLRHKTGQMRAIGMKAWLAEERLQLIENVRGFHEPK